LNPSPTGHNSPTQRAGKSDPEVRRSRLCWRPCRPGALTRRCERPGASMISSLQGIFTVAGRGAGKARNPLIANIIRRFTAVNPKWRRRPRLRVVAASRRHQPAHRISVGSYCLTGPPRCRRHHNAQAAKVWYLTPASAANLAALNPLRLDSSSKLSRRAAGVCTRPRSSVLRITSAIVIGFVIAESYDIYAPLS